MKANELTGAALDWAVASYADKHVTINDIHWGNYTPSTNWAQGGPIIEREKIEIFMRDEEWYAASCRSTPEDFHGDTPLIAAMRCYVASVMGDEIEIPEGLK